MDLFREKKNIVKTSRGLLSKKSLNRYVEKTSQHLTFACSYCHSIGKPIDVGKMFG